MTVTEFEMGVRARGTRGGLDDEERWKELAHVRDGRREKWMTDRAKHALGTPKLASVFLQEEKGRVYRLRKIKSVLASENLMGNSGGATSYSTTQSHRRGRRRPYLSMAQQGNHTFRVNHRRFPNTEGTNYPTNPFGNGNVGKHALLVPESAVRSPLTDAIRNSRGDSDQRLDRSRETWNDDSRAIQEVVSVLAGGKEGLFGSHSDLGRADEALAARSDRAGSVRHHRSEHSSGSEINNNRDQLRVVSRSDGIGRAKAEETQPISSGPSAIDLFDQCGLVPTAAVEKEGLVGTTRAFLPGQESDDQDEAHKKDTVTADRRHPAAPALLAPKPPLVPGGVSSTIEKRGVIRHGRDTQTRAPRGPTKWGQATIRHGVQPRPPFNGGSVSTSSRSKPGKQQQMAGKMRRGAPTEADTIDSTTRRSRVTGSLVGGSSTGETSTPAAEGGGRVRRRWNVDGPSPTATGSCIKRPGATAGAEPLEGKSQSSVPASVSTLEERIASAKERLHKDKGLDALKSEHVEALSILQDISCPSTAAVTADASRGADTTSEKKSSGDKTAEDGAVEAAKAALLHRTRTTSSANAAGAVSDLGTGGLEGLPADAEVDEISADLPRIGSEEKVALRTMYRAWWMKVANGASPPTLGESDRDLGGKSLDLAGADETAGQGRTISPVDNQSSPRVAEQAMHEIIERRGGDTLAAGAAGSAKSVEADGGPSDEYQTSDSGAARRGGSFEGGESKKASASEDGALDGIHGAQRTGSAVPESGDGKNKPCVYEKNAAEREGRLERRDQELSIDVPGTNGTVLSSENAEGPPTHRGNTVGGAPLPLGAQVTPRAEGRGKAGPALAAAGALAASSPLTTPETSPQKQQQQQQQQQQQAGASDVESVSEDDGLEKEEEEGLHGRIYLPDGRFVSTLRHSGDEMTPTTEKARGLDSKVQGVGDGGGEGAVVDRPAPTEADDESLGYADEDFEFED